MRKQIKIFITLICLIAFTAIIYGFDLTELTEDTNPTSDDLIYTVNDPSGTPANKKVTLSNLASALETIGSYLTYDGTGAVNISGTSGNDGILGVMADAGEDNNDKWQFVANDLTALFELESYQDSNWESRLSITGDGYLYLWANDDLDAYFQIAADDSADDNDLWRFVANDNGGTFDIETYATSAWVDALTLSNTGTLTLPSGGGITVGSTQWDDGADGINWSVISGTPTTIAGYGITDNIALKDSTNTFSDHQTISNDKYWQFGTTGNYARVLFDSANGVLSITDSSDNSIFEFDLANKTIWSSPTSTPEIILNDDDNPGTDKYSASLGAQYVDGADGSENNDVFLYANVGGAKTTLFQFDESDSEFDFQTFNLVTTGSIQGVINVSNQSGAHSVTQAEATGTLFINTGTADLTLPDAPNIGSALCAMQGQGISGIITIQPNTGDYILEGSTRQTAATDYASSGTEDDKICVVAITANDWLITSKEGTWSE